MGRVSKKQKIFLALSPTGYNIAGSIIGGSLLKFYTDFIGLGPLVFGLAYFLYGIWNTINDPLIGYYSDKVKPKGKKGKRLPFIRRSFPVASIGMLLMIFVVPTWDDFFIFMILVIGLFIYDLAVTFHFINFNALTVTLTEDQTERASINMITSIIGLIPGAVAGLIPFFFLTGDYSIEFVVLLFLIVLIAGMSVTTIAVFSIKEPSGIYRDQTTTLPIKEAVKEVFKSKAFICLTITSFAMSGIGGAFSSTVLYLISDVYRLSEFPAVLPATIAGLAQIITMPIIIKINKKLGVRSTLFIVLVIMLVGFVGMFFVPPYPIMIFFYWCILTGFFGNGVLTTAANGDIIDEDELKTGERREGMFFGIGAILTIPASSIFVLFFTLFLSAFGYDGTLEEQLPETLFGIQLGFSLFPMIFLAIAAIMLYFYPLHGEYYKEMKLKVRELFEKKFNQLNEINEQ